MNKDKKDYVVTTQLLYGMNTRQATAASKDNPGQAHNLLPKPQPIPLNLEMAGDEASYKKRW